MRLKRLHTLRFSLFFLTLLCLVAINAFSQAQPIEITGLVNDHRGAPVGAVSVVAKNTNTGFSAGTTTDSSGRFTFRNLPAGGPYEFELTAVNFLGQTLSGYTIKDGDHLSLLVTLQPSLVNLKEVVVTGYSAARRGDLTSAITTVSSKELKDVTTNDIGSMLQGKVPGLQVVAGSGAPGASDEIRLRGVSSVNASLSPLYVVDGIIGGDFDPNDVETISVLKDAGATAMYGSQANGGVIVITTKKAASGKTRFELKVSDGFRKPDFGTMQMMNASQLYEYQKEFYRDYIPSDNDNSYKIDLIKFYNERPLSLRSQNFDWLNTMFKTAPMQNFYFSTSGRTEKADYYLGMSYYNEKGTLLNTMFRRINVRANSTYHFSPKVSLTNNINLSAAQSKSYDYMSIYYAYLNLPWDNPLDSLGNPIYVDGASSFKWWSRDKINPLHTIKHSDYPARSLAANYDLVFNWDVTKWLSLNSSNRIAAAVNKSTVFVDKEAAGQYHGTGYLNDQAAFDAGVVTTNLAKFNFLLGDKHRINGLAGQAWQYSWDESLGGQGRGLPPGLRVLDVVSNNILVNGATDNGYILSYISQVNYSYDNKYFLTGSYRYDGSSAFPPAKRWGSFPAFSAAWMINREHFLQDKTNIDLLRLRGSWGITGTQDIGASRYLGLFDLSFKYNNQTAASPSQLPSPLLTWESKYQTDIGFDLGLFQRINLTVDVYNNRTKNLLLQVPVPLSVGMENQWENVGEITNKGIEIGLSTINITTRDFEWSTIFNVSFNSNKLGKLPTEIITTGPWAISQIYQNGGDLYEFYMPKWLGVDPQTGAPLWEKVNTDADGKVIGREPTSDYASATLQAAGAALPWYQGSVTSQWRYKGWSLSVNAYFTGGNKVYSNNLRFVMNDGHEPYYNQIAFPLNYTIWSHPGDIASNPSPQNDANSNLTSTRFLFNGDFINIRNITLSYDLPHVVLQKMKMNGVTLSVTADNVHTFTKFLGQDPQASITPSDSGTPGVSDWKYPNNRQFLFNISFRF